jgi:hypothetical protein
MVLQKQLKAQCRSDLKPEIKGIIQSRRTTLPMEARLAAAKANQKNTDRVEMAVGMRGMVVLNLATEGEIANGTKHYPRIHDIIPDEREECTRVENLRYPHDDSFQTGPRNHRRFPELTGEWHL